VAKLTFGERLRDLREARGLTQADLADRAGLTRVGLGNIERGERVPGWDTVQAICAALGVSCVEFEGTVSPATDAVPPKRPPGRPPRRPRDGGKGGTKGKGRGRKKP
jgi:transcriptional regulator with XRE-family HTH domain